MRPSDFSSPSCPGETSSPRLGVGKRQTTADLSTALRRDCHELVYYTQGKVNRAEVVTAEIRHAVRGAAVPRSRHWKMIIHSMQATYAPSNFAERSGRAGTDMP